MMVEGSLNDKLQKFLASAAALERGACDDGPKVHFHRGGVRRNLDNAGYGRYVIDLVGASRHGGYLTSEHITPVGAVGRRGVDRPESRWSKPVRLEPASASGGTLNERNAGRIKRLSGSWGYAI
jgi:hypothetical protein